MAKSGLRRLGSLNQKLQRVGYRVRGLWSHSNRDRRIRENAIKTTQPKVFYIPQTETVVK